MPCSGAGPDESHRLFRKPDTTAGMNGPAPPQCFFSPTLPIFDPDADQRVAFRTIQGISGLIQDFRRVV